MNDPTYFFTIDQAPKDLAAQIMGMAEGTIAEVVGSQGVFVEKFEPYSYSLSRKSGIVDLEITCFGGIDDVEYLKKAMLTIADERGITQLEVPKDGVRIVHLYFYPKQKEPV